MSLWGVFHYSQLAARQMVKQGGGSVHAARAFPLGSLRNVPLPQDLIGRFYCRQLGQTKFLGQTALPSPETPLRATPRLRRIGRNHLHPEFFHRPSYVRAPVLIHLLPSLHRYKEMARPITLQSTE